MTWLVIEEEARPLGGDTLINEYPTREVAEWHVRHLRMLWPHLTYRIERRPS